MTDTHHILTVVAALSLTSLAVAQVAVVPATVTDEYGNTADEFSDITFVDIPDSVTEDYVTDPGEYSYNGLKPLFDGIHGFVKSCFGKDDPFGG